MHAIRAIDLRDHFKTYCEKAANGETLIIRRPGNKNVVVISEEEYNKLEKASKQAAYFAMLEESLQQAENGQIVVKTMEELENMERA